MRLLPRLVAITASAAAGLGALLVGPGAPPAAGANLATLALSSDSGRPGATITITGASFVVPRPGSGLPTTPVVIRWRSEEGPVLAEVVPNRFGSISATITVPEAGPGTYTIVGSQRAARVPAGAAADFPPALVAEPGTPARASFEVVGEGPAAVGSTVVLDPAGGGGEFDATVWIVLTAAFGAVALSLFGGGLIAFIHQSRRARMPAEARWVPPGW